MRSQGPNTDCPQGISKWYSLPSRPSRPARGYSGPYQGARWFWDRLGGRHRYANQVHLEESVRKKASGRPARRGPPAQRSPCPPSPALGIAQTPLVIRLPARGCGRGHLRQWQASPPLALKAMLTTEDAAPQEISCNPDPSASKSEVAG